MRSYLFALWRVFAPKYFFRQIWEFRKYYYCKTGKAKDFTIVVNDQYYWKPTVMTCPMVEPHEHVFVFMCKVPIKEVTIKTTLICYKERVLRAVIHDTIFSVKKDDTLQITYTFTGLIK